MKKVGMVVLFVFLILFPEFVQIQPAKSEPSGRPGALRIGQLEMFPDSLGVGQGARFVLTPLNRTSFSGKPNLSIRHGDEVVAEARYGGSTLSQVSIGPYIVEDLEMVPDPAKRGQEVRFNLKLRNSGIPVRANIRIEDRDEIVARVDNVSVEPGIGEYQFPHSGYFLQRFDHCFTIVIEVEGKLYKAETTRELCAKPLGCPHCPD